MSDAIVQIYDIMACNVYMDSESTRLRPDQHKFLVSFFPTDGRPFPELIERITASGPHGYQVAFVNQPFSSAYRNGYIYDRTTNAYWYMVNLDTGFLDEGVYTIDVQCKDGTVQSKSRRQRNGPSDTLVSAYSKYRDRLYESHSPGKAHPFPAGSPLTDVEVKWSSLKELGHYDAFYVCRLSEGRSSKEFDPQNLVWWDNIFARRGTYPEAGRNRNSVTIATALKPATSYVYFTEITDSNAMAGTNICIFQPHQTFST